MFRPWTIARRDYIDCLTSPLMETFYESPLGLVKIEATAEGITALDFVDEKTEKTVDPHKRMAANGEKDTLPRARTADEEKEKPKELLARTVEQLNEYFSGKRTTFDLPLALHGTPFQQQVWKALQTIPYGKTATYLDIAQQIGNPGAVRAVGQANGRNPVCIIIPCHRVVASRGIGGYSSGIERKEWLLKLEGVVLEKR